MKIANRSWFSQDYRYGFNGKELDQEGMGGGGSTYDYGFRIYNPQLAKFLSVDPLTRSYPWYTPYQFAGNMPIAAIDLDGLEERITVKMIGSNGKPVHEVYNKDVILTEDNVHGTREWAGIKNKYYNQYSKEETNAAVRWVTGFRDYADPSVPPVSGELIIDATSGTHLEISYYKGSLNLYSSVYIGPDNPVKQGALGPLKDRDGNVIPDYSRSPQDLADAAARSHDKAYDLVKAIGLSGVLFEGKTLEADVQLVRSCQKIVDMYNNNEIDPYTGVKISQETYTRASEVIISFTEIADYKAADKDEKAYAEKMKNVSDMTVTDIENVVNVDGVTVENLSEE